MKIYSTLGALLVFVAGCTTYPDNQYSSTYSTPPAYSSGRVISSPTYSSTTTSPSYSSVPTQGAAASSQLLTDADRSLANSVRSALNDSTVAGDSRNVYIDSRNGTVTLTGTVPTEQDRQFIDNVVRNTSGVYSVNDQLQVGAQQTVAQPTGAAGSRVYSTQQPQVLLNPESAGTIFNLHVQGLDEPDRTMAQRILQELRTDTILPSLLPSEHHGVGWTGNPGRKCSK